MQQKLSLALTITGAILCHQLLGFFWLLMFKAGWDPGGSHVWSKELSGFFLMLSVPAGSAHVCMDRRDVISGKGLP